MNRNLYPVGPFSGRTSFNSRRSGWWLCEDDVCWEVVVKSFMDGHNFWVSWFVVEVGGEDFVVAIIPRLCFSVPGKLLSDGIVSKSGFLDKIDT